MLKKKFAKIAVTAFAGCLAVFGCMTLAGCGGGNAGDKAADYKLVQDGKLTVITSADYKPMEYQEDGQIKGFDADLIKLIADKIGLQADIQNMAFDTLVTQIAGGAAADVSISSITITDERAQEVDFSEAYYDSNLAIVVLGDSKAASKADLNSSEITVGAQSGSSGEEWAKENLKDAKYVQYQETPDLLAALRTGKIDAAVYDDPVAEDHIKGEYKDCKVLEVIPTGEQYGIIVNKANPELTTAINQALADMEADGSLEKLKQEYGI